MAIGLITYNDSSRPEDVLDLITNIDFTSTPFISSIGRGTAMNTLHEWQIDSLDTVADNAGIEGADVTIVDHSGPTRKNNVVQTFQKIITVSDTERAIAHYGMGDPFTYQTGIKMKSIARDIEKAAIAGTRASGASGVARRMDGAIALITSNKTAQTSGTSFTEDVFNALMQKVYDGGTDESVDMVFAGGYLKRVIDKFTTNVTRNVDASEMKQTLVIKYYESSFGTHAITMERNIPTGAILGVDTSKWRMDWLTGRELAITNLGKTGSATKALLEGEATLVALNEKSSIYSNGFFVG